MAEGDRPDRYDAVIEKRGRETDQAARRLALRERELLKVRTERARHAGLLERSGEDGGRPAPGQPVEVGLVGLDHGRGAVIRGAIARADLRIAQLERDAAARRQELVVARQRQRAAEVLRERLHGRIAERKARAERIQLDEIAVLRHGRGDDGRRGDEDG